MDDDFTFAGPRPSRADAVKNRAALVETARRLFAEQGVEAVSMTAIADAAGVGKGTLYRHFDCKAELCLALLDAEQHTLQDETLRRLSAQDSPLEKLKWFLESVVRFIARNDALLRVEHGPDGPPALAHPAHLWWRQTIVGLLRLMHDLLDRLLRATRHHAGRPYAGPFCILSPERTSRFGDPQRPRMAYSGYDSPRRMFRGKPG